MPRSTFVLACLTLALGGTTLAQTTSLVSVDSNGIQGNNYSGTYGDAISADGRFVAFGSGATNLVPGGSPLQWELFLHDRLTGATTLASVDSSGIVGSSGSFYPVLSADGSVMAFESDSGFNTGDSNGRRDVFVRDFSTGTTSLMSVNSSGVQWPSDPCQNAAISGDGRYVAFVKIHYLVTSGHSGGVHYHSDVLVHDRQTGTTLAANVNTSGVTTTIQQHSNAPSLSATGRYVAFASNAPDLVTNDGNAVFDVFVRDLLLATTTRVSLASSGIEGNADSTAPSISGDGRYVAFVSVATNLVPVDANGVADVFVHDLVTGATVLASVDSNGVQANAACLDPHLSADGRFVAFHSAASNLVVGDGNGQDDVFVRDLLVGTTRRISAALSGDANGTSVLPSISGDGRFVAFRSSAGNLVANDGNGTLDVFVRDQGVAGSFTAIAGAGCAGSAGVPVHTATGTAEIGGVGHYALANAPGSSLVLLIAGFSDTLWATTPLPFDLGAIGAPGCMLRVQPAILDPEVTQADGSLSRSVQFAHDPALIGAQLFTQFAAFDPSANAFGWTLSNAIGTQLGGWL